MTQRYMNTAASVEWETPQPLFDRYHTEFSFTLDAAASPTNAKCPRYITEDQDTFRTTILPNERIWLNPPYGMGNLARWVKLAADWSRHGSLWVCLLPSRTDAAWFHEYVWNKAEVRFLRGRLKFGGSPHNAPFPNLIAIFGSTRSQP